MILERLAAQQHIADWEDERTAVGLIASVVILPQATRLDFTPSTQPCTGSRRWIGCSSHTADRPLMCSNASLMDNSGQKGENGQARMARREWLSQRTQRTSSPISSSHQPALFDRRPNLRYI